jgi:hypothetical protein
MFIKLIKESNMNPTFIYHDAITRLRYLMIPSVDKILEANKDKLDNLWGMITVVDYIQDRHEYAMGTTIDRLAITGILDRITEQLREL